MIYSKQARLNEACSPVLRQSATSGARGQEVQKYIEQQEEHHKKDDFRISEF